MVKKSLLSIAIAASVAALAGCNVSTTDRYDNKVNTSTPSVTMPKATAKTYPAFDPANSELPLANDIVFANAERTDGTAYSDVMPSKASPVTTALQQLAGFSTVAPLYIDFISEDKSLSADTDVPPGTVWLINAATQSPVFKDPDNPSAGMAYETRFVEYNEQLDEKGEAVKPNAKKYALQISPTKPLDPGTQYMVVVTDGIKDDKGNPIGQSSMHALLSDTSGEAIYPSGALVPAAGVVQLWNGKAAGAAEALTGLINGSPVLAYTFRTDNGLSQLKSYAAPALFATTAKDEKGKPILDENSNPKIIYPLAGAMKTPAAAQIVAGLQTPSPRKVELIPAAGVDAAIKSGAIEKVRALLKASGQVPDEQLEAAATQAVENGQLADGTPVPGKDGASPATILGTSDTVTRFIQGQIELPNFLPGVELTTLSADAKTMEANIGKAMLSDKLWTANDNLASMKIAPPKDMDGSTNVTYHFPFPKPVGVNTAPLMITMPAKVNYGPAGQNCSAKTEFPVAIYVHGITGSRGNMLAYASALAANCIATVGIDMPLHGVAPQTTDNNDNVIANALTLFNVEPGKAKETGSPWGAVASQVEVDGKKVFANLAERHNNVYQTAATAAVPMARMPIVFGENAVGDSGSAFINLQNFGRTRDNLRQAVTDLLNLNASLGNISDALDKQGKGKLDTNNVFVVGHSLGSIVAATFTAVNNDDAVQENNKNLNKIKGAILANGGAHITKFLENSPKFAPVILGGLAKSGVMQGTEDFEKFIYIMQSTIDAVEPANAVAGLKDTPVLQFSMVGGGALPIPVDEPTTAAWNKVSLPDYLKNPQPPFSITTYMPDNVVPVAPYFGLDDATNNPFAFMKDLAPALALLKSEQATANAPLIGANGLATLLGFDPTAATTVGSGIGTAEYIAADKGTHSTFANADDPTTFTAMVKDSVTFILTNSN